MAHSRQNMCSSSSGCSSARRRFSIASRSLMTSSDILRSRTFCNSTETRVYSASRAVYCCCQARCASVICSGRNSAIPGGCRRSIACISACRSINRTANCWPAAAAWRSTSCIAACRSSPSLRISLSASMPRIARRICDRTCGRSHPRNRSSRVWTGPPPSGSTRTVPSSANRCRRTSACALSSFMRRTRSYIFLSSAVSASSRPFAHSRGAEMSIFSPARTSPVTRLCRSVKCFSSAPACLDSPAATARPKPPAASRIWAT